MRPTTEPESEKSSPRREPDPASGSEVDRESLLDRLKSISDKKVDSASRAIARFSEDDDANERRWAKAELRRTFYKIRRWFFWFLFGIACTVITVCSLGYIALVALWVGHVVWGSELKSADGLKEIITGVLWTILVVLATLFGESVFSDKDN